MVSYQQTDINLVNFRIQKNSLAVKGTKCQLEFLCASLCSR
jgi:hypothetical protein